MSRACRDPLTRVNIRPSPEDWRDDEAMTLAEAAAVFFPDGPLTVSSLRTAARAGELAIVTVAGKDLTTPRSVKALVTPCPAGKRSRPVSTIEKTKEPGSSSTEDGRSAQAAAAKKLKGFARVRDLSRRAAQTNHRRPSSL
jgi:hypothetical protein